MEKNIICGLLLISLALVTGCAPSGYSQFYTDYAKNYGQLDPESYKLLQPGEEPKLMSGSNPKEDSFSMLTNGYIPLGFSSFNGKYESMENVKAQAVKVGATDVLVYSQYTNTVSGSIPITTYSPGKYVTTNNYGNFNMNTYGNSGYSSNTYGNYSGTSSTYVPGSSTTNYMPYNVQRYDQAATFFIKRTKWGLGVQGGEVPEEIKKELGSNKGVLLSVVVKNTPAYEADLFAGDVVIKLNDSIVRDQRHLAELIKENRGRKVDFQIYRDGKILNKSVGL